MLKRCRLRKNASFQYVYRKGTAVSSDLMTLIFVRNLAKRRINENLMRLIPRLKDEYNYVVVAKEGIAGADFRSIGESLETLLIRAGHLN